MTGVAPWAIGICKCGRAFLRGEGQGARVYCSPGCAEEANRAAAARWTRAHARGPAWHYGACAMPGCHNLWRSNIRNKAYCSQTCCLAASQLRGKLRGLTFDASGRLVGEGRGVRA